jgi:hypothetical protein
MLPALRGNLNTLPDDFAVCWLTFLLSLLLSSETPRMPGPFLFSRDLKNSHALEAQKLQDAQQVLLDASISATLTSHAAATEESALVRTTNGSMYVLGKRHKGPIYSVDLSASKSTR